MVIRKPFDTIVFKFSECGSYEYDNYSLSIDENGSKTLVKTGVVNLHNRIQSFKDGCDIYKMLANGSMVLPDIVLAPGVFDSTRLPKNIFEANALVNTCKSYYNSMPEEIRNEFSYNDYIQSYGRSDIRDRLAHRLEELKNRKEVNNES